jgi:hypothetical protein
MLKSAAGAAAASEPGVITGEASGVITAIDPPLPERGLTTGGLA